MIIFVRHGQTDFNITNKICGLNSDILINQTGLEQARSSAEKLKGLKIDVIFCSPMLRTLQTAREIWKFHKDVPLFLDERLMERDWKAWEGEIVLPDKYEANWTLGAKISKEFEDKPIEPLEDMQKRVYDFWKEKLADFEGKNVVVVSHEGVARFSRMFFGEKTKDGKTTHLAVDNASPFVLKDDAQ